MDSLFAIWNNTNEEDTTRGNALTKYASGYIFNHPDSCIYYVDQLVDFSEERNLSKQKADGLLLEALVYYFEGSYNKALTVNIESIKEYRKVNYLPGIINVLSNMGLIYEAKGNYRKAIDYHSRSLSVRQFTGDSIGVAISLSNIGIIHDNEGNITEALDAYSRSLFIYEKLGVPNYNILSSLGNVYKSQGEHDMAHEYYVKALEICRSETDKNGEAAVLSNMGTNCFEQGKWECSMDYAKKSLKIKEELNDLNGIAISYNNIGAVLYEQEDYEGSLKYDQKALVIRKEIGNMAGVSMSYHNIGNHYKKMGNIREALKHNLKALEIAEEIGNVEQIANCSASLYEAYYLQGKHFEALKMYKRYILMRDSVRNEETQKATIRQQTQYEFEKAQIIKENEAKEARRLEQEERSRKDNLQYSFIFLGIIALFGIVLSLGFVKVSPNVAEGLIFFAFLILFEFILVFTDPYLDDLTHEEPMYNLAANALIALLIFPVHSVLERLLKKRIVKN